MRRLSIIDLAGGHQPLFNENRSVAIVCNGEIYNYVELRHDLERRHRFATRSDVETLVHLYEERDLQFLDSVNGMFALALWDTGRRRLILARDRIGKKPLHYWLGPDVLVFGSEIKAVLACPVVPAQPDWGALRLLFRYNYIPAPLTAWVDVREIPAAHLAVLESGEFRLQRYWSLPDPAPLERPRAQLVREADELLRSAVNLRLRSDVPVGLFLSGGVDSSLVAAYALEGWSSHEPVQSFTISFPGSRFDEAAAARRVAKQLGTRHREIPLGAGDLIALYERMLHFLDEPFGDLSFLPTFVLSEFAAQHVKVVLTGDGGDEMFAGYERYVQGADTVVEGEEWRSGWEVFDEAFLQEALVPSAWSASPNDPIAALQERLPPQGTERALWFDRLSLLYDNNVVKPDRMAMAHGLEARCPLLDYRVATWAASVPTSALMAGGRPKSILRDLGEERYPAGFFDRPKGQFSVPIGDWMRGPLAHAIESIILTLAERGLFRAAPLHRLLGEHRSGQVNHTRQLRVLLAFELWLRTLVDHRSARTAVTA